MRIKFTKICYHTSPITSYFRDYKARSGIRTESFLYYTIGFQSIKSGTNLRAPDWSNIHRGGSDRSICYHWKIFDKAVFSIKLATVVFCARKNIRYLSFYKIDKLVEQVCWEHSLFSQLFLPVDNLLLLPLFIEREREGFSRR